MEGDVRDASTLPAALAGVERVVSAVTGFGPGGDGVAAVDESGNANLIGAAEKARVRRFILVSAERASADHPMELMRRKHAAEQRLRAAGMEWAIVRPTPVAEVVVRCVQEPGLAGATLAVGGPRAISMRDLAKLVARAVGSEPKLRSVPLVVLSRAEREIEPALLGGPPHATIR